MIAMAMLRNPALLIADEPTTALDVTVQAQILDLMRDLVKASGTGLILITHDMGVVAEMADACWSCAAAAWWNSGGANALRGAARGLYEGAARRRSEDR